MTTKLMLNNITNLNTVSQSTQNIINGYGYRIENDRNRDDLKQIVTFEVQELHDTDIYDTLVTLTQQKDLQVLPYIDLIYRRYPYGLWLAPSLQLAVDYYGSANDDWVAVYDIGNNFYLLSDLDTKGALFALPKPVEHYWLRNVQLHSR